MKHLKSIIALFVFAAGGAFGQSAPAFGITQTNLPITQRLCQGPQNAGSIVTTIGIAGGVQTYLCQQTGAASLGQGAFAWLPLQLTTSAGGGSLIVASGKMATINNSLTFSGTDATTATFPSVSIAVPGTVVNNCGTANACSATNISPTSKVVVGTTAALNGASPAVAAVTGMPAFTSSTSYICTANVNGSTASAVVLSISYVSATAFTVTATNGATATVGYVCIGS